MKINEAKILKRSFLRRIWTAYINYVRSVVLPASLTEVRDISYWRNEIFFNILTYIVPVSILALVPSIFMAFRTGVPVVGTADVLAFSLIVLIMVDRRLTLWFRKFIFVFIIYSLSLILLYYLGKTGTGFLFLLTLTFLVSIIYTPPASYYSALANTIICFALGLLIYAHANVPLVREYSLGVWIAVSSNLVLCSFVCAESLNLLLGGLEITLSDKLAAQKELENTHDRLVFHIENTSLGFIEWDNQLRVKSWSKRAEEIFGWTGKEYIESGMTALSEVYEEDLPRVVEIGKELVAGAVKRNTIQHRNYTKDGRVIWCEWFNSVLKDNDGNVLTIMSLVQDITEQKEAAQQRAFDRNNLKALLNNTNDLMWSIDSDFNLITSNHAFDMMIYQVTGRTPMAGSDMLVTEFGDEQLQRFRKYYERALSGESFTEIEYVAPPLDVWSEISFYPIYEEEVVIGTACFSRDITERKRNEKTIKDDRILLKTLINNLPAIIYTKDLHSKKTLSNRADYEHVGAKSEEEVLGKDDSFFSSAETAQTALLEEQQLFRTGESILGEEEMIINKNGTRSWYLKSKIPLRNQDNEVVGLIGISLDITARKEAENEINKLNTGLELKVAERTEQLALANKELEGFSYSVSHDLRAPLRIIHGYGQILVDDYASKLDEDGQKTLEVIMNNAERMGQLIDDLLRFSQLGRTELIRVPIDMNKLVEEVVDELRVSGVSIPALLNIENLKSIKADPGLLKQVWMNLISNAIKYSGKVRQPAIEIGMKCEPGENVYFVKDNGAGFDMKYYQKLFGVFQRLHNQNEFNGTGVGLALTQRIVLRHGGKIWAEAKPNEGATFYFSLPE
jgi:PAS domain S-box-containing protein